VIEFLDPHSPPGQAARHYGLGLGSMLDDGEPRIGLLANGFADSEAFLDEVQVALATRVPRATFVRARKPSPTVVVSDDTFADLVERCDAVISAYGH
jgi:hypothetical protein